MRSIFFIALVIFTNTVFSQAVNGVKTVNGVAANSSGEITISGGGGITLPQLTDSLNLIRAKHLADSTAQAAIINLKLSNITGLVTAGTGATVTGSGTPGSPYVIAASGGVNKIGFTIADGNFENGTNNILSLTAGWSVNSDGIAISSSGGWGNAAIYNKASTLDKVNARATIKIVNASSIFSIIRKPVTASNFGTVVKVDCSANTISFMGNWNGSTTPTSSIKSVSIPFTVIANNKYNLDLGWNKGLMTATFTDETTPSNTVTLTYSNTTETYAAAGREWGAPGIMFLSGSIVLKRFTYSTLSPLMPNVLISGHSFVEGGAFWQNGISADSNYTNLLYNSLGGDAAISGRGGALAADLLTNDDITFFSPKYTLIDIGANDTDSATYVSNVKLYINKAIAYGSIPVLMTIVPRADRQTFINKANSWIRASGYNYVDNAKAVTTGNDGITQNSALFFADAVHPNSAGAAKIFNQIQIDAPYLFKSRNAFNTSNQLVKMDADGKLPALDGSKLTGIAGGGGSTEVTQIYTGSSTVTINDATTWLIINPATTASAITITMPATPTDKQMVKISFGGTITSGIVVNTFTTSPNTGQGILGNTVYQNVEIMDGIQLRYNSSNLKWYR